MDEDPTPDGDDDTGDDDTGDDDTTPEKLVPGVALKPIEVARFYGYGHSLQGGNGFYHGEFVWDEGAWVVADGPLESPSAAAEDDPFATDVDGWLQGGISSFAEARLELSDPEGWTVADDHDVFELSVINQATQETDTGQHAGAEGWGYSVAYLLVTYATEPLEDSSIGDPLRVVLELDFCVGNNPPCTLYTGDVYDEYFLDVGYAVATGLTDYDPVLASPATEPNPGLDQFAGYRSWSHLGPDLAEPSHSDVQAYIGVIGDEVGVLIALSSFSYSSFGYAWTDGSVIATVDAWTELPP